MPMQRRLPKRGFTSRTVNDIAEIRLSDLQRLEATEVDLLTLKAAKLAPHLAKGAKVFLSGKIEKAVTIKGLGVTKGAKAAIEAAGGSVA